MKSKSYHLSRVASSLGILMLLASVVALSQSYRTFNQVDLGGKKAKAGKSIGSTVCFTFRNDITGLTVNSLHARINAKIVSVNDSGGFPVVSLSGKDKVIDLSGKSVAAGDSVKICLTVDKKGDGAHTNSWWWDTNGVRAGDPRGELAADNTTLILIQPNGGNVREYLYKKVIRRPNGLLVGLPNLTPGTGWIRYKTADRKYFPHSGAARCFDELTTGSGGTKNFVGELKNPHVKKHDNSLLGELHALKLAVIANDSGIAAPDSLATKFGDLIYNDAGNLADICNGRTIRGIIRLADSALTYCDSFPSAATYNDLKSCIVRINTAFDGPYEADNMSPLHLKGTNDLSAFAWLHPNPAAVPARAFHHNFGPVNVPEQSSLAQNYPNPFNPTTSITFSLSEESIVSLRVYNVIGQEVATLLNNEHLEDGEESVEFDASSLTSGVYFYRLSARGVGEAGDAFQSVKRMLLVK